MAFDTVLIANRGEIAWRVIRTAKRMGYKTVALYTDADRDAPHVSAADQAIHLEDQPGGKEPYLDIERIVDAAHAAGAGAVHPGYGFLSENAAFSEACAKSGLVFIGPDAEAIHLMGDKGAAKRRMETADVPCVPGYQGEDQSEATLKTEAEKIGAPVLIKAVAGGGGRGMRRVDDLAEFDEALASARSEAQNAFGSGDVILERALDRVRHVEVQVMADSHGNVVHLGERDCSSQRRNQKVIEEAPSPAVDADLRARLGEAAVRAAAAIDYRGAGTLEFLLTPEGAFYFIEMNTRLQVEHPVTEAITGLDLVEWQLRIAAGEPLPLAQDEISFAGAAIEARLYAEDPAEGFMPQTGTITEWREPNMEGLRIDHGVCTGLAITPRYDPMIAKVIASGETREAARQRLIAGLSELRVAGFTTNKPFLVQCLLSDAFATGEVDTGFIDRLALPSRPPEFETIALAMAYWLECRKWRSAPDDWSTMGVVSRAFGVVLEGDERQLQVRAAGDTIYMEGFAPVTIQHDNGDVVAATIDGHTHGLHAWFDGAELVADFGSMAVRVAPEARDWDDGADGGNDMTITAPMDGRIVSVEVAAGDAVEPGQAVLILEAMKMEHRIRTAAAGAVGTISVAVDDQVARGDVLLQLEESA